MIRNWQWTPFHYHDKKNNISARLNNGTVRLDCEDVRNLQDMQCSLYRIHTYAADLELTLRLTETWICGQ